MRKMKEGDGKCELNSHVFLTVFLTMIGLLSVLGFMRHLRILGTQGQIANKGMFWS